MPSAEAIRRYATDPAQFLNALCIPSAHGPVAFGECMADFQRERFASIIPALQAVAHGECPPLGRHWWEATKLPCGNEVNRGGRVAEAFPREAVF